MDILAGLGATLLQSAVPGVDPRRFWLTDVGATKESDVSSPAPRPGM